MSQQKSETLDFRRKRPKNGIRPSRSHLMENTRRFFDDGVLSQDVEFGEGLYRTYHQLLRDLADYYGFPLSAACGAFAVLSPNNPVDGNFRSLVSCMIGINAGLCVDEVSVTTYGKMKERAFLILRGEADFDDLCRGPKITAFRHNLLFPVQSSRVTIDGHMVLIMLGHGLGPKEYKKRYTMKDANFMLKGGLGYDFFEKAFSKAANEIAPEIPLCSLQAIMWHARRRHMSKELPLPWLPPPAERVAPYNFRMIGS